MRPRFLSRARDEYLEAARYYRNEDPTLALALETQIEQTLGRLCAFPKSAKPLDNRYRSQRLGRFPYCLIYRIDQDEIVVVALAHTARKPSYWKSAVDKDES